MVGSATGSDMKPIVPIIGLAAAVFAGLAAIGELEPGSAFPAFAVLGAGIALVFFIEGRRPAPTVAEPQPDRDPLHVSLQQIIAALPDPAVVVGEDGLVLMFNERAAETLETLRVGQSLSSAVRAPVVLDALQTVLDSHEATQVDYEQRVPIERHFEVSLAPLQEVEDTGATGPGGPAALVLMRDLTQQEKVERMRADFVAYASHELRTPLSAVLGFIETLQGAAKEDPRAREEFLELMRVQANRMTRLIGDLLSLSRIELRAHVRPDGVVDLDHAVRHVLEYLAPLAAESGLEIEQDLQLDAPQVPGDWDELVQVIQNLVENAIKYGRSGKRVEVTIVQGPETSDGAATIDLKVRDFGLGIAPEHVPRLTERFYRVDVAESRATGGTGLGLAIVKHIANRHRGRLFVDSEPGQGSVFTVRLPQALP